jgi:hypothetical protein
VDVQRRSAAAEISPRSVGMGKRKSPPTNAPEAGIADDGSAEEEEVVVVQSPSGFPPRPARPQGSKAAKAELVQQKKREKILVGQARATESMAEASLLKATAPQDQCAMSLFTMPMEEGMSDEAKRYFTLRRQEEIHRLERRMRLERRAAELEHSKQLNAGNLEATTSRRPIRGAVASPAVPIDSPAAPWAPSPTIADTSGAGAVETPRPLPVFTGTRLLFLFLFLIGFLIVGIRVWGSLLGLLLLDYGNVDLGFWELGGVRGILQWSPRVSTAIQFGHSIRPFHYTAVQFAANSVPRTIRPFEQFGP